MCRVWCMALQSYPVYYDRVVKKENTDGVQRVV